MPVCPDIKKTLIIGAGPIVIGQACEFDYSGVQACKALRSVGIETVLVNSNPATIMTDPEVADRTYVEPLVHDFILPILERERPDTVLPTLGGQTALNLAMELDASGALERYGARMIGATPEVIHRAEDRQAFKACMESIGLASAKSRQVSSLAEAREALGPLGGLPVILRPSFTLGGHGGSIVYNQDEFEERVAWALAESPVHRVLIEESALGWKEYELEVMRDNADNVVIVCSVENLDPMGIHTGDSITVAPQQTLSDREYQDMRDAALRIIRAIGVETGGANIQFAVDPKTGRQVVIEMNPRVSRSSALASKATGYPIAKIAALVAVGMTLDEIPNDITGETPASFEPTIDYVVTKVPRFTFEKFPEADATLGPQMKSVGEAMAIGRTFPESLGKALRSLETGRAGLQPLFVTESPGQADVHLDDKDRLRLDQALAVPGADRIWAVADAFRAGRSVADVHRRTAIDPWFLRQIREVTSFEQRLRRRSVQPAAIPAETWRQAKELGIADERIAALLGCEESAVRDARLAAGVTPVYKLVDTCAAEFAALTPYHYSAYDEEDERLPSAAERVIILGGGPNRIGQGIEFDCCCVQACYGLRDAGHEAVMINCNPETVSTDWDTSDRLYFEPITFEDVMAIVEREAPRGVMLQFGGQTPLKLANRLAAAGVPILGTPPEQIDRAEDREAFNALLDKLGVPRTRAATVRTIDEAKAAAATIGYPLIVRPSFVLGGRAMVIVHEPEELDKHLRSAFTVSAEHPLLVEEFLNDAVEVDVDVIGDGSDFIVAGVMEHVEEAGVHSGDSACALPPFSLPAETEERVRQLCRALAAELQICGLMNVQIAVRGAEIFVLEVNPRASRTVPFVSKVTGVPLARIAARAMVGDRLTDLGLSEDPKPAMLAVKEVVFPFDRFYGTDTLLGPEMKSTGEVIAMAESFELAFAKAQIAVKMHPPTEGSAFISVGDVDKSGAVALAGRLHQLGFALLATTGTADAIRASGVPATHVNKVYEGRPHCVDAIRNGEVQLVINTCIGAQAVRDSKSLREAALRHRVPYVTTMAAARAMVGAISAMREQRFELPPPLQALHGAADA